MPNSMNNDAQKILVICHVDIELSCCLLENSHVGIMVMVL
jgi:hypothetical protein